VATGRAATFEEGAVACERLAPQRLDESLGAAA
jgi:hypothetical protein